MCNSFRHNINILQMDRNSKTYDHMPTHDNDETVLSIHCDKVQYSALRQKQLPTSHNKQFTLNVSKTTNFHSNTPAASLPR